MLRGGFKVGHILRGPGLGRRREISARMNNGTGALSADSALSSRRCPHPHLPPLPELPCRLTRAWPQAPQGAETGAAWEGQGEHRPERHSAPPRSHTP